MLNRQLETTEPGVFVDGAWRHGSGPSLTVIDPCPASRSPASLLLPPPMSIRL